MRFVYLVLLVAFAGAVGVFAYQNRYDVNLTFFNWTASLSVALLVALAYVLGMLSGWTVVGMLRKTVDRAFEPRSAADHAKR